MQEELIIAPIAIISTFGSLFGILYLYITARNRERMALIERGLSSADIFSGETKISNKYLGLKLGLLIIGIGLGILAGMSLSSILQDYKHQEIYSWSFVMIFGGIGLFVSYLIEKKDKKLN